ncbi:hypothetical protein BV25DRAFT_708044 [Artomyces pyxidatus]|uniref:Uncharacterized protein n=1 Tax=Artomyces pyxidatus TaxID=48021 RepID=A0ACB8SZ81_9AGAM|nr:hypothetical protein BV25DRAFT_708044 [Artomyces pyxidatus]
MSGAQAGSWLKSPDPDVFWDGALQSRLISSSGNVAGHNLSTSSMTIHELDLEDAAMQRVQSALRFQRNYLLSVHRLPPEIVALTFSFYVDENRGELRDIKHVLGWIVITHVCRRWRQIALESAELWQQVTFELGDVWAEEMYRRSKGTALKVNSRRPLTERQHGLVAEHLHRTKALTLGAHAEPTPSSLLLSSDHPAPILKTLEIHELIRSEVTVLPLNRFGTFAPNLRHVEIHTRAKNLPWTSTLLTGLVTLKVESAGHKRDSMSVPSLNDVLSALEQMKALEFLDPTGDIFPRKASRAVDRTAKLPRLTTLKLNGPIRDCSSFLSHIKALACTMFCLALECSRASLAEVQNTFSVLTSWTKSTARSRVAPYDLRRTRFSISGI